MVRDLHLLFALLSGGEEVLVEAEREAAQLCIDAARRVERVGYKVIYFLFGFVARGAAT